MRHQFDEYDNLDEFEEDASTNLAKWAALLAAPSEAVPPVACPRRTWSTLAKRNHRTADGRYTAYRFAIVNWNAYPADLFADAEARPCVTFRDAATDAELGTSCPAAAAELQ